MGRPRPSSRDGREEMTPPASINVRPDGSTITQVRRYRLITPLFGGGVKPGANDELTPISGKAVRGHLRFWWRATRGGRFGGDGLAAMREAEQNLFGAASTKKDPRPSKVQIAVSNVGEIKSEQKEKPYGGNGRVSPEWKELAYAAFPLQDNPQTVAKGITFDLTISFPDDHKDEVSAALWAWETFGGIGARTRRGFGALRLVGLTVNSVEEVPDLPVNARVVREWIKERLEKTYDVTGCWPEGVPHLFGHKDIQSWVKITRGGRGRGDNPPSAREIWQHLIQLLKNFRQARYDKNIGKHKGNTHGLSHWPEAYEIRRRLRGTQDTGGEGVRKFPRARLGLPIVFHLPHDVNKPSFTLKGEEVERWASPLILRPLACADDTGVGLAMILSPATLPETPLTLTGLPSGEKVEAELTRAEASQIYPLRGEVDVLKAFLSTVR